MSRLLVYPRVVLALSLVVLMFSVVRFSTVADAFVTKDDPPAEETSTRTADHPFYLPEQYFLINHGGGFLTGPADGDPLDIAHKYLKANSGQLGLQPSDLADAKISSMYRDDDTGVTHIYLRQVVSGLEVSQANIGIHITGSGEVICVGGGFVPGLAEMVAAGAISRTPSISPGEAVRRAADILGLRSKSEPVVTSMSADGERSVIDAPGVSLDEIRVELRFVPTANGGVTLSWEMVFRTPDNEHWYDLNLDAARGELASLSDWIRNDSYTVVPLPNEHPNDGIFQTLIDPYLAATNASPFGWHDTNGVAGAEFSDTRGNNVDAHLDRDDNNTADPGSRPNGGALRNFNFVFDPAFSPVENAFAAVTNLFYWNNTAHDVHYQYGFTALAGNFQTNNYGAGGLGNDAVQADGQDGSGTDNANFGTPPDGSAPRMQMYEWTSTTPRRDSDLDSGVILHEYGHGVSNRLTGGPADSNALNNLQSGGMGEGWSDFYALMFTQRPGDSPNIGYGVGTYLLGQPPTGTGIRAYPYSFNKTIDPIDFDAYGTSGVTSYGLGRSTAVHRSGTVWNSTLWDLNWLLIDKYGYDTNLYTGWTGSGPGGAGNKLVMRLVMDAMKLQPANPSFIQARDAIRLADTNLTGGANQCEIWRAFARRGLGETAATASSNATTVTLSFAVPASCGLVVIGSTPASASIVAVQPTSFVINFSDAVNPASVSAGDLQVNGTPATGVALSAGNTTATFTYGVSPVTTQGLQTMSIAAGAVTRASDADGNDVFSKTFRYDTVALAVTTTSPAVNSIFSLPTPFTLDVNFNQAVAAASITTDDLILSIGTVTNAIALDADTARYTISGIGAETTLNVSVGAFKLTDTFGNPNTSFVGSYQVDIVTLAYPSALAPVNPLGSLVYGASYSAASVQFAGDTDAFTIPVDAGQLITVRVTPASGTLRPGIEVRDQANVVIATGASGAAGQVALVQSVAAVTGGTYQIRVTGVSSTTGGYTVEVILNSAIEIEGTLTGAANDSLATAQDLSTGFSNLANGASRAAVVGRNESTSVLEIEPNNTTGTAIPVLSATSTPADLYQLGISGAFSSGDQDYINIGQLQAGDIITISESGAPSGRGTTVDPLVRLYRAGSAFVVTSNDDGGPGFDSLIHRFTITVTDTYYVQADRLSITGTWQLGIRLENSGVAPTTGGIFTAEIEPNETIATADDASGSWRQVNYQMKALGSLTPGDSDVYSYQFTAGDVVTLVTTPASAFGLQSALLNSAGTAIATDDGLSSVGGTGISPIFGYVIPTSGTYYYRVSTVGGLGTYSADVYRSTTAVVPVLALGRDLYSITLAPGDRVSVGLKNVTAGNLDIAILDSVGGVVATGVSGPTNIDELISDYVAPLAPGLLVGNFYVQVNGAAGAGYQLVVLTRSAFDAEPNDSLVTAQDISGKKGVLGHTADNDYYSFVVPAGQQIALQTRTPGDGPVNILNTLDPVLELYDPANTLIASGTNIPDGRNERIIAVASNPGTYRVRVGAGGGTSGAYFLSVSVFAPTAAGVSVSGRVTSGDDRGVFGARVVITDGQGVSRSAITSSFGYFRFDDVPAGQTYIVDVSSKRYVYASQVLSVSDEVTDLVFAPIE